MNRGKVYSVTSINQFIKNMFSHEYVLSVVFVKGEISNCKYHSSGHIYFTVKDSSSQLACVMFRGDRGGLDFQLENGQEVVIGGSINVYEPGGRYQLYAKKIVLAGDGDLAERYEQLKKKLERAGYFDEDRKLPIPKYVKRVGIVTAKTGAAIQDMIQIAGRRNPYVQLVLYPAKVQGEGAAETIVRGIQRLEEENVDVIIVGRGGGSMEDLWAFNEEMVADAIFYCRIPVISAVGHETDVTIADFVADLRAPTPSAAAELAVYDVRQALSELYDYKDWLARQMLQKIDNISEKIAFMAERLLFYNPENQLLQKRQFLTDMEEKLTNLIKQNIKDKRHAFALLAGRLDSLSPLKRLQSGYAYISDNENKMLYSVSNIKKDDIIQITMADGAVTARAQEVTRYSREE
ncbi:MAG: exodeoxyribonuclease VII large subunit [Lachnospiraceae bacterium]|nr:exodeoxyribonuclease VII large subunit [Lachnospiraceae bacterium]